MVRASAPGRQRGRGQSLVLAAFLTAGLLVLVSTGTAQNPTPAKAPPKADPPKAEPAKPEAGKVQRVIVAKGADVAEMTKFINEKLEEGWKANKITPSREVSDLEFLRRCSLDIIGRVPTWKEIKEYQDDPPEKRRSLLVERLLSHADYARHWANVWSNWLLTRSGTFGRGTYHEQMDLWLEEQFALNKPYSDIVRSLITAKGKNTDNGAVNFILAHVGEEIRDPKLMAEEGHFEMVPLTSRVTRLFLGIQIQCAQCHDHPFLNTLKQEKFWGVNAFLRQVERKGTLAMARNQTPGPLELADDESVNKEALGFYEKRNGVKLNEKAVFLPSGPQKKAHKLSADEKRRDAQGIKRREELADALIEHDQFPKAVVNRYWGVFFGRGFVNPIDDFNDQNPPSNPELLNEVAAKFKHYGYDLKSLIRWICNSEAYQLSCVANKTNDKPEHEALFSRMMLKSMSPEQLYESLMVATNKIAVQTKEEKKDSRTAWLESLISNFGDDEGNEVNFNGTVVQALMMMNGQNINDAITLKDKGTVANAIASSNSEDEVITKLFLASVTRQPSRKEILVIKEMFQLATPEHNLKDRKDPAARFHDLFWALLNSNEFLLNH
jgi:Protein of unknown function (DUF1549)/Protein of unknown function (DUF1553)